MFHGYYSRVAWMFSLRLSTCFISFWSKVKPPTLWRYLLWYFYYKQKEVRLWVCCNTFRNLNERRVYQTINIEWTAEKCLDNQQTTNKLGNRTNRWSKVQADARCLNSKKQLKKQRWQRQRQRRLINDLIFSLLISWEVEFIQFVSVYSVRNIPNRIYNKASKVDKRNFKTWPS